VEDDGAKHDHAGKKNKGEATKPADAPAGGDASGESVDGESDEAAPGRKLDAREQITVSGAAPTIDASESDGRPESVETTSIAGRYLRLDVSLGGGVAVVNGEGGFVQTTRVGLEAGRHRVLLGGEGTLWLSRGIHAEGTLLGTVAWRHLLPRTELGGGLGLHLGGGIGPAFDLLVRHALPFRPLWLYLRYDAALLFHDGTRDGQNTGTIGIEAHF
jgi:hypothetical protein